VRQDRIGPVATHAADVQDVHVDFARSVHEGTRPPDAPLDAADRGE
jgi:hypothetical protein